MLTAKARRLGDGKPVPLGTPLIFEALAFLPIPSSFTRGEEAAARAGELRPTGKPDLDNWIKLPMDALEGIAYANDSQIVGFGNSGIWYAAQPRLELHVYYAPTGLPIAHPMPVEIDPETLEAMVCTGCGTTKSLAAIRASHPGALSCCPERKMIPVRAAIEQAKDEASL